MARTRRAFSGANGRRFEGHHHDAGARVDLFPVPLPPMLQSVAVAALAVIFSGRGLSSFTPWFRASQSEEPFATLDRRLYGPLCLALGTGFAVLVA